MTPDHIAEIVLIEISRLQREAFDEYMTRVKRFGKSALIISYEFDMVRFMWWSNSDHVYLNETYCQETLGM